MLIRKIEVFLRRTGMPPTRFGRLAARDPRFVFDLRDGREPRYPNRFASGPLPPSTTTVLRQALAHEPDHSVVIVQVGFSTNLARFLDSPPDDSSPLTGEQLVQQKVRLLSEATFFVGLRKAGLPEE